MGRKLVAVAVSRPGFGIAVSSESSSGEATCDSNMPCTASRNRHANWSCYSSMEIAGTFNPHGPTPALLRILVSASRISLTSKGICNYLRCA